MQTNTVNELFAYWNRRRGAADVPDRCDIEPADIGRILPDTFILEHVGGGDPRFRLAGTGLCTAFGRELRAGSFNGLFAPDIRNRLARIADNIMAHRTPAVLLATAHARGGEGRAAEIALLPMTSQGKNADRIIGAFALVERPRLADLPLRFLTLDRLRVLDPRKESALLGTRSAVDLPASVIAVRAFGVGETVRRVLHLRVFEGGKGN